MSTSASPNSTTHFRSSRCFALLIGVIGTAAGLAAVSGCGGEEQAVDEEGELVVTAVDADPEECEEGGTAIVTGFDENGDGTVDEERNRAVVCDGTEGEAGPAGEDADCAGTEPLELEATLEEVPYHRVDQTYTLTVEADVEEFELEVWGEPAIDNVTETDGGYTAEVTFSDVDATRISAAGTDGCHIATTGLDPDVYPPPYEKLDADTMYTCGLRTDGTVDCWGEPEIMEQAVGDNSTDIDFSPLLDPPEDDDFVDISVGAAAACGLHENGELTCWTPHQEGEPLVAELSETYEHVSAGFGVCAIPEADRVTCGLNNFDEYTAYEVFPERTDPKFADVGLYKLGIFSPSDYIMVLQDGSAHMVVADGDSITTEPLLEGEVFEKTDISFGAFCGINADERLRCQFELTEGDGDDPTSLEFESDSSGAETVDVASGIHGCSAFDDGSVECVGEVPRNENVPFDEEQIDFDPDELDETVFDVPDGYEFVDVATGFLHACGLTEDQGVVCWGDVFVNDQVLSAVTDAAQ